MSPIFLMILPRKRFGISLAAILVACAILLSVTGNYKGDGRYFAEGIFPFRNYRIMLPEFPITAGGKYEYRFRNSRGDKSFFPKLVLSSKEEIPYWAVAIPLAITLKDETGNSLLYKEGPINHHYARMWKEKETSWPLDEEWRGNYLFEDPLVSMQAVLFSAEKRPLNTKEMTYWGTGMSLESMKWYSVTVAVDSISGLPLPDKIVARLELVSSWK